MEKVLDLKKRIIDICYKHKISHITSYITSVGIIDYIYNLKKDNDIFILSSGHCALAYYVVLEKYLNKNAEELFLKHGGHPHYDISNDIHCSTGSLGQGLPVGVGRAIGNKSSKVYVLISDGECAEGSIWESLKFIYENNIKNIEVHVNVNGYCAYNKVDVKYLVDRLKMFLPDIHIHYTSTDISFLKGINGHYHIMKEEDYEEAIR
jgi:transketolase|tara:strand:- start:386 stop:1006 length:621 start_codon:yes stop_codon:yes gene_type:complete